MQCSSDAVNDAFHEAYASARAHHQGDAPIFVLLGDELVVHHRGGRRAHAVRAPAFHVVKAIAHAPIAFYVLADPHAAGAATGAALAALAGRLAAAEGALGGLPAFAEDDAAVTLRATREALDDLRGGRSVDLATFARAMGPRLLALTRHATAIHLALLDARVEEELARLSEDERRALQVVVAGDHQARARSLGMQYFARRLPGGSPAGERVIYAEGITDEAAALALVGQQRLDREIAAAFFADPGRLQRDVLGDAAAEQLDAMPERGG